MDFRNQGNMVIIIGIKGTRKIKRYFRERGTPKSKKYFREQGNTRKILLGTSWERGPPLADPPHWVQIR